MSSTKFYPELAYYFCPSELEEAIAQWVKYYYNESRFHESLDNLTPRDVYLGQGGENKKDKRNYKAKFNQQKNF